MRVDRILIIGYATRLVTATCLIAGLVLGMLLTFASSPTYSATSRVLVSPDPQALKQTKESGALLSYDTQRTLTYAEVAKSSVVVGPVVTSLRLASADAGVDAIAVPGSQLVEITATASTPSKAAALANGVADQLVKQIATIERPTGGGPPTLDGMVVLHASPPGGPARPLVRNLLLGLLLGLIVAALGALARLAFGRDVTDADAVIDVTGAPPIGTVVAVRGAGAGQALIVREQPQSAATECYRRLAATLQHHDLANPARSLVVAGVNKRSGGSNVAANLAVAVAEVGHRVVVVDADLRQPRLAESFGAAAAPGIAEALDGGMDVRPSFQPCGRGQLAVVPAGGSVANPGALLGSPATREFLQELTALADVVIIDAPPMLDVSDGTALAAVAEGVLLVVRYGRVRGPELQQAADLLDQVHARFIGTVLLGVPGRAKRIAFGAARPPVGPARGPVAATPDPNATAPPSTPAAADPGRTRTPSPTAGEHQVGRRDRPARPSGALDAPGADWGAPAAADTAVHRCLPAVPGRALAAVRQVVPEDLRLTDSRPHAVRL